MDIEIKNLVIDFTKEQGIALMIDNLTFKKGCITSIIGESGSGKSILGKSIVGLLEGATLSGEINYGTLNLCTVGANERRKQRGRQIFFIPQDPALSLNPCLTIEEQLIEGLEYYSMYDRKQRKVVIEEALHEYGFLDARSVMKQYPFQLSGGMKQRIMCLMALLLKPQWIIADEPTKGLDAALQRQTKELFTSIRNELQCGLLFITHDIDLALEISDDIVVLQDGNVVLAQPVVHKTIHTDSAYVNELLRCQQYFKRKDFCHD